MPHGITPCYLPPGRGDIPALTPTEAGTRFSDPRGMQGRVDLWRPWAGSLLDGPLPTLKWYNLHALTIVIITKYIYIYFYTL